MTAGSAPERVAREPRAGAPDPGHVVRPATADDLATCAAIWRDALNDYLGRLAQPEIPEDFGPILRLYAHLLATDPATFLVAERSPAATAAVAGRAGPGEPNPIDAFVVVVRRERLAFLSMLFVRPPAQGRGLGRRLLAIALPEAAADAAEPGGVWRATATDSAQPISNGKKSSRLPAATVSSRLAST